VENIFKDIGQCIQRTTGVTHSNDAIYLISNTLLSPDRHIYTGFGK
jgi:hypothetical protein